MTPLQVLSTVSANLTATGCALLLLRRGPSRRLKLLTLSVGLMSLSQSVSFMHISENCLQGANAVVHSNPILVAVLSLFSIYLLGTEIYDRNFTDKRIRLMEHDPVGRPATAALDAQRGEYTVDEPEALAMEALAPVGDAVER